jgi:hypothetical protein
MELYINISLSFLQTAKWPIYDTQHLPIVYVLIG